jgi:hypothetical protein
MELRQHQYCSDRRNSTPRKPLATHDQGCMAARWGSTPHDDAALGSLRIDEGCFILGLPDDATEYVLLAAREHGQLGALSTACQRFCALARGRIPANIHIEDAADACKLLQLQLGGVSRPPFSHCDSLYLAAEDAPAMYQLQGVLGTAAAQWTALTSLDLTILPPEALAAAGQAVEAAVLAQYDCSAAGFLMHLAGLKQLQRLKLTTVILGPLTAIQLGRCQALTSLLLHEPGWDEPFLFPTPPDLSPLSSISRLVDLSVVWEGGPKPPAAADGPYALPSSLRVLRVTGDTAYWLQHLPGCPHLEQLALDYGGYQHASAHPAAVLQAAAKHTPGLRSNV